MIRSDNNAVFSVAARLVLVALFSASPHSFGGLTLDAVQGDKELKTHALRWNLAGLLY